MSISRIRKERQHAEKVVVSLLKNHPWIESEKSAFGVEGGDYDFKATNADAMSRQLNTLKGEQESLVRNSRFICLLERYILVVRNRQSLSLSLLSHYFSLRFIIYLEQEN